MSTKQYQFSLTWNLSHNSKSVENQKTLQLQKLFQITPSFSTNFIKKILTLRYFSGDNSISAVILELENKLQHGPPVNGAEADTGPTYRRCPPTWLPPVVVSFFTRVLKWSPTPD
jgi:hypothetical protein